MIVLALIHSIYPYLSHLQKISPRPQILIFHRGFRVLISLADGQRSKVGLSWLLGLDLGSVRMWMPCV